MYEYRPHCIWLFYYLSQLHSPVLLPFFKRNYDLISWDLILVISQHVCRNFFLIIIVIVVVGLSAIVVVLCHNCFYNNDKKCYRNSKITVGVSHFIIFGGIVNICHFLLLISVCCNFGKCKRVLVTQTIYIKNGCIIISL